MKAPPEHATHAYLTQDPEAQAIEMQALVDAILSRLIDAGIPYCLLRNRDLIPWGMLQWSDLDIMVPTEVTRERLTELLMDLNAPRIVPFRDGLTVMFFPLETLFLRVDFIHGEDGWLGASYTNNREILDQRWNDRGVMVASLLHQAYLTWCNRLIRGGTLPDRYEGLIARAMRDYPHDFRHLLEQSFGRQLADQLVELVISGRVADSSSLSSLVRRRLWVRAFRQRPVKTLLTSNRHILHGLLRRIRPSGLEIAIVGPEGAAASLLCSTLAYSSSRQIPGNYAEHQARDQEVMQSVHWASRHLPGIGTDVATMVPRSHHPATWALICSVDLVHQWLRRLLGDRGKLARMAFIFRDRHSLQMRIEPERFAYSGPPVVARWAGRLAPKPDLLIVLDAPPEGIQTRRQDVRFEETTRKRDAYRALADSLPDGRIVDVTEPFEKVMSDVIHIIWEFTASQSRRRFIRKQVDGSAEAILLRPLPLPSLAQTRQHGEACQSHDHPVVLPGER